MPKENVDEYLEAILDLAKGDERVKTGDLAARLKVTPASATEAPMFSSIPNRSTPASPSGVNWKVSCQVSPARAKTYTTGVPVKRPGGDPACGST